MAGNNGKITLDAAKMKLSSHSPSPVPPKLSKPPTMTDIYDLIRSTKRENDNNFAKMDKNFEEIVTSLDNIKVNILANTAEIDTMKKTLDSHTDQISRLQTDQANHQAAYDEQVKINDTLRANLTELKTTINYLQEKQAKEDREKRRNNLIIQGLPENNRNVRVDVKDLLAVGCENEG